jgi:hypothetical protein
MPGLVLGIHVLFRAQQQDVDGRDKPGHDENFHHRPRWQVVRPAMAPISNESSCNHQKPLTALPRHAAMPTCFLPTHFLEQEQ